MKNNNKCCYESGNFDFHFRILNIFSLNGTEISSKLVSYSAFLYNGVFVSQGFAVQLEDPKCNLTHISAAIKVNPALHGSV